MECKSTPIKLLRLKLTDVYFLVLITVYVSIISTLGPSGVRKLRNGGGFYEAP